MYTILVTRSIWLLSAILLAVGAGGLQARSAERVAESGDAFVDGDASAGTWTVGTRGIELSLLVTRAGELRVEALRWPGGPNLSRGTAADGLITSDGRSGPLGGASSGFRAAGVDTAVGEGFVEARVRFRQERGSLLATRHYRAWSGAAAVEVWTSVTATGDGVARVEDLNAVAIAVPAGRVHWVGGLETGALPFTRHDRELDSGESLVLGSPVVSSSHAVPFVAVAGPDATVFAALAWSGGWEATLDGGEQTVSIRMGLPEMSTPVSAANPVEGPHAWVGVAPGDEHAASAAMQQAMLAGRHPPPSWTTYNTWFVHGIGIDEAVVREDIDQAARLGLELFQLDAGWYPRRAPSSIWDFTDGLGSWQADRTRFPSGLGAIGDYARERGMRFAVWVEPERVALSTVGQPGLAQERFLATQGGAYDAARRSDETPDGQICLGERAAREWLLARLTAFIDESRPDYLKWDYNRWLICDREDHDHGARGGSYAHVRGLYEILETLRERFPSLQIENCSSGGHRLDAGLARLTDAGWMDDRSAPSRRVRHNLEGLTMAFPAGYLLSYVMPHEDEPMADASDMAGLARSRMPGTLGVAVALRAIGERQSNELAQEVHLAQVLRPYLAGSTYLLTGQAGSQPAWDVVQQWLPTQSRGVLWAFDNTHGEGTTRVRLKGIDAGRTYEIRNVTTNQRERVFGASLLEAGFELRAAQDSSAQVYTIEAVGESPARVR